MGAPKVLRGDILSFCRHYRGEKFHALLCDPPYHLISDTRNGSQRVAGTGPYGRHKIETKGFMGKKWDGGGIAFDPDTWAALAEHLHPGAFGMAFASSRGWHRLAVAIEDAGLRIHPSIFGWAFGSGFPKATRIDTQIDKAAGKEQRVIGNTADVSGRTIGEGTSEGFHGGIVSGHCRPITEPSTSLAKAWVGHRYGLQAMKPALEPIIVFQKPYEGKPVECITETGAGALNIDGARIGTEEIESGRAGRSECDSESYGKKLMGDEGGTSQGRWPANFYLGDEEAARRLGEQSGERASGGHILPGVHSEIGYHGGGRDRSFEARNDTGTAARFFFNVNRQIDEADPILYHAKASRKERDAGLTRGDTSTGMNAASRVRNHHPTVKPIDLTRWLATLLLPPSEYAPRRILVPFAGSGSEMIGAHLAGWDEVIGIEREREYVEIARERIAHWMNTHEQLKLIRGGN